LAFHKQDTSIWLSSKKVTEFFNDKSVFLLKNDNFFDPDEETIFYFDEMNSSSIDDIDEEEGLNLHDIFFFYFCFFFVLFYSYATFDWMDALNLVSYFQETEDGILCAQEYFFLNMFTHYRYLFFSDYMEDLFNTLLAIFSLFSNFYVATEDDPFYELFFFFDCEFFEEFVSFANANEVYDF